jgi:hypothetical protein
MDEKDKEILASFTGRWKRSKLAPHSDLIWKLHQRGCPFREIVNILSEKFSMTVAVSTLFDFIVRLGKERSKPRRTRLRKEKPIQGIRPESEKPAVDRSIQPSSERPLRTKIRPQSDEALQRIKALKQLPAPVEARTKVFDYNSDHPLTLEKSDD